MLECGVSIHNSEEHSKPSPNCSPSSEIEESLYREYAKCGGQPAESIFFLHERAVVENSFDMVQITPVKIVDR